mmetsp:Transcript_52710/g.155663  ORF Transcript_52710/g.155663 Transcript_52710/m.155663 type:complete len:215 (-) Transcript_52710:1900-2544(-)
MAAMPWRVVSTDGRSSGLRAMPSLSVSASSQKDAGSSTSLFSESSSEVRPLSCPKLCGSVVSRFLWQSRNSRWTRRQRLAGRLVSWLEWIDSRRSDWVVPMSDGRPESRFFSSESVRRLRSMQSGARSSSDSQRSSFSSSLSLSRPPRCLQTDAESERIDAPPLPSPIDVSCSVLSGASPRPLTMSSAPSTPSGLVVMLSSPSTRFCCASTPIT